MKASSDYINRISREYGLYVLDKRAIPAMSDGLKSSQRIALWLMRNRADKIKTISLVGEMIASNLYVHGDAAAGDTISLLAAPYCNNVPLLGSVGAFGTLADPTSFGAPRYTYVKRNKFAQDVLYTDIDIVPMVENYDGSAKMPGTFLPILPLVLLNGIKGIATGWSTNILPRRLEDLISAVKEVLSTGKVRTKLLPHFEGRNVRVIDRGEQQYTLFGNLIKKNTTTVIVDSLPPDLTLEKFKENLIKMEEDGKITDWVDHSSKTIYIEIKMRRADLAPMDEDQIIEFLRLRTLTTENITVQGIGGNKITTYESAEKLVEDWVDWRLGLYLDRYQRLLEDEYLTNLYWRYVLVCFEGHGKEHPPMPQFAQELTVAELRTYVALLGELHKLPKASSDIIERIINVPIFRWTTEGLEKAKKEMAESDKRIAYYEDMVKSDRKRKAVFKKEVDALV